MYYVKDQLDPTYVAAQMDNLVGAIALVVEMRMHCGGYWRVVDYWGRVYWDTGKAQPQVSLAELY
jgi:hypothetical protein